jgi:hypothetical protein
MTIATADFNDPAALDGRVRRHPGVLRWATLAEIRTGRTRDGANISPFPASWLALEGLLT